MFAGWPAIKLKSRLAMALAVSLASVYWFLSPINVPLYTLVMFPCPDPRTPDLGAQFKKLASYHIAKKDLKLKAADGRIIRGWFLELPYTRKVILYSHGKGNNIYGKIRQAELLLTCGASVLMYDYRGYGCSQGKITVDGACDDAVTAYDYLIKKEGRMPEDIVAFGESFGCGVTGQLVARRKVSAVILQSGFSSLVRAGRDRFFWLRLYPDWMFPKQIRMDNVAVFKKPHPPLLIVHGKVDPILPLKICSRALCRLRSC